MNFGVWDESIHFANGQAERIERSKELPGKFKVDFLKSRGKYHGTEPKPYRVTLDSCTCMDFQRRGLPCKHMYRLVTELENYKPKSFFRYWRSWAGMDLVFFAVIIALFAESPDSQSIVYVFAGIYFIPGIALIASAIIKRRKEIALLQSNAK